MALRGGATDATRATLPMIHMRGPGRETWRDLL